MYHPMKYLNFHFETLMHDASIPLNQPTYPQSHPLRYLQNHYLFNPDLLVLHYHLFTQLINLKYPYDIPHPL